MLYLGVFLIFLSILIVFYRLFSVLFRKRIVLDERMNYIENMEREVYMEAELSFSERVIAPLYNSLGKRFMSFSPEYITKKKRMVLERAGLLKNISYERFVARRLMIALVATMMFGLVLALIKAPAILVIVGMIWLFAFIQIVYRFTTRAAIDQRSKQMVRDLPYTLDLITVSVEAGLSLDGAIGRIVVNIPGVLSDEFGKTLKEMRMGIEKKQALRNMSERCDVRDLSVLINALIQADELGVSLGKVLRIEGSQLREKRRQAAREKAMKAPIKILFPLMLFIFPAVFIVILGPAVIQMIETFR